MSKIGSLVRSVFGSKVSRHDAFKAGMAHAKQWTAETGEGWDGMVGCFGSAEEFIKDKNPPEAKDYFDAYRRGVLVGFGRRAGAKRR